MDRHCENKEEENSRKKKRIVEKQTTTIDEECKLKHGSKLLRLNA